MRYYRLLLLGLAATLLPATLTAAENPLDVLNALRKNGYHDYALLYLKQLEGRSQLPDEIRQLLPMETALTLLEDLQTTSSPEEQHRKLDLAREELQKFLKQSPDHERAALANDQLGKVLLEEGRVEIARAGRTTNATEKQAIQKQARGVFQSARDVFTKAVEKHKAALDEYKAFIDEKKEPQLHAERERVRLNYLNAQISIAKANYFEASSYGNDSDEKKKLMQRAIDEFEKLVVDNSQSTVFVQARVWQGRCYQELGEIRQALGLFDEVLRHAGTHETLQKKQDEAQWYRLQCLNHEKREDYQLVVQEATDWENERAQSSRGGRRGSRAHLGILWEKVRALEGLANQEETSDLEKRRLLRDALDEVQFIKSKPGEFQRRAATKERELRAQLNLDDQTPQTFDDAFAKGKVHIDALADLNGDIQAAERAGDQQAKQQAAKRRTEQMDAAVPLLELAISLADQETDIKELNRARYMMALAYYYLDDHTIDTAAIADFVATRYKTSDPSAALDAAFLSMFAYFDLFTEELSKQPPGESNPDNTPMMQNVIRMASLITTQWPDDHKADEARMKLGRLYSRLQQYLKAVEYYGKIAPDKEQYQNAQVQIAIAYWNAYLGAMRSKSDDAAAQDWLKNSRQHLSDSIEKQQKGFADDTVPDFEFVNAKLLLATVENELGNYAAAVELLSGKSFPVLKQVVAKGERPATGEKSAKFASRAYQQAMRAYVGTRNIERAQAVLNDLEQLGGGDGVVNQLVLLGKQLQEEVERLRDRNDPRLPGVLESFEEFLDAMYQRKNQTLFSLYWIGLTYVNLGEGLSNGKVPAPAAAAGKFARAADVFTDAIARCKADPEQTDGNVESNLKARLVHALRRQGKFEDAKIHVLEIVKQRPRATDVQQEAAMIFTDWAQVDTDHAQEHLTVAIGGLQPEGASEKLIWGWGPFSKKLMNAILANPGDQKLIDQFAESRYWLAVCRMRMGLLPNPTDEQIRLLRLALNDLNISARSGADISSTPRWDDLVALNQQIHEELGETEVTPLVVPRSIAAKSNSATETSDNGGKEDNEVQAVATTDGPTSRGPTGSSNLSLLIAAGMTLAFVAIMGYLLMAGGKKKRRSYPGMR